MNNEKEDTQERLNFIVNKPYYEMTAQERFYVRYNTAYSSQLADAYNNNDYSIIKKIDSNGNAFIYEGYSLEF